jgi:hypothetical protein
MEGGEGRGGVLSSREGTVTIADLISSTECTNGVVCLLPICSVNKQLQKA